MIPECACLRHDCSCPAAVEAAPPLVLAQMHGGLDSSRRLALSHTSRLSRVEALQCGSRGAASRSLGLPGGGDSSLADALPALVTEEQLRIL